MGPVPAQTGTSLGRYLTDAMDTQESVHSITADVGHDPTDIRRRFQAFGLTVSFARDVLAPAALLCAQSGHSILHPSLPSRLFFHMVAHIRSS